MSHLRFVLNDHPAASFDNNFGLDDIFSDPVMLRSHYTQPWHYLPRQRTSNTPKEGFHVKIDVLNFKPEDISVKRVSNCVTVEAKHEERQDEDGYISRHFVRRYVLPDDVEVEYLEGELSSDGILSLHAPKEAVSHLESAEHVIPIRLA